MSVGGCLNCQYVDRGRKQGEKIRCKRWSKWVMPYGESCCEYGYTFPSMETLARMVRYDLGDYKKKRI